uniref:Uncharacterized protein n=1 Tax=viral metagenome TaxID=1070528 RepID=A0A6C0BDE2_9ZZZZ
MNDKFLSVEEVTNLSKSLKDFPATSYINHGVNMVGDVVEIFNVGNFELLYGRFVDFLNFKSDNQEIKSFRDKFVKTFNTEPLSTSSMETKIGKLCSAFVVVRMKNWSQWYFYKVPERYQSGSIMSYNLTPEILSPMTQHTSSPTVIFQQISPAMISPVIDRNRQTQPNSNAGNRNTQTNKMQRDPPRPVQLFGGPISTINTRESVVKSLIPNVSSREINLGVIRSEKSKLVELITSRLESTPHTKILCDRQTGICTFARIDEDERFETSSYRYCPFHTGKSYDSFNIISESIRSKITGPYGYLTKSSDCYDFCYLASSTSLNTEETNEIEKQRSSINNILTKIETDINEFNNLVDTNDNLSREEIQSKQTEQVTTSEVISSFGENASKNIQSLQAIANNPIFKKDRIVTVRKRKDEIEYKFPDLSFMTHQPLSSFFGTLENTINLIDTVDIKGIIIFSNSEGDQKTVQLRLQKDVKNLIIKHISDIREKVSESTCEILNNGSYLQIKMNKYPISFVVENSTEVCESMTGSRDVFSFGKQIVTLKLTPIYDPQSYRGCISYVGNKLCQNMGISQLVGDRLEIILNLGACFISKFSDIVKFIDSDEDPLNEVGKFIANQNNYCLVNSEVNKFEIPLDILESTVMSLEEGMLGKNISDPVSFTLGDYNVTLSYNDCYSIKNQLTKIPEILDDCMILEGFNNSFKIQVSEIREFFKEIENKLSELSKRALYEDRDDKKDIKMVEDSFNNLNIESDGWKTLDSYKDEIKDDSESNKILSFGGIKVSSSVKSQKSVKNENKRSRTEISETGTVVSGITEATDFSAISRYNTRYFSEQFEVFGYTIDGFEGQNIISEYYNLKQLDLDSGFIKVNINAVPLIKDNMTYIISTLFATDETLIDLIFDEDFNLRSRKFTLLCIFFLSNAKYIKLSGEIVKLRSELSLINPFRQKNGLKMEIPSKEAVRAKILNRIMTNLQTVDKTAIFARKSTIEIVGDEIFRLVFAGYQPTINGSKTSLDHNTKEQIIPLTRLLINKKLILKNVYENVIIPFLQKISPQDFVENKILSFYGSLNEYVLFSKNMPNEYDFDIVIPTNPMYSANINGTYNSAFIDILNDFVEPEYKLEPIPTRVATKEMRMTVKLIFDDSDFVSLSVANPKLNQAIVSSKYSSQILKLGFMIKFMEITGLIKMEPEELKTSSSIVIDLEELCEKFFSGQVSGNSADSLIKNVENRISDFFGQFGTCRYKKDEFVPKNLFDDFVNSFEDLASIFRERRVKMRVYVKTLISKIYNVTISGNSLSNVYTYERFSKVDEVIDNGNTYTLSPDKIDIISQALEKVSTLIKTIDEGKFDSSLRTIEGIPILNLDDRVSIFNKFADIILQTVGEREFKSIRKSVAYYYLSISKKSIYLNFLNTNYTLVFNNLESSSLAFFKQAQDSIYNDLLEMSNIKKLQIEASNKLSAITSRISKIKEKIEVQGSLLLDKFIEYVSIIDIIAKSYEGSKKSYGAENSLFNELIQNMKLQLESVRLSYLKVNSPEVKIILSLFNDNLEIYNVRKNFFRDFKFTPDNLQLFDSYVLGAIDLIKINAKLSYQDQERSLNNKLADFGLNVKSNITDFENVSRTLESKKVSGDRYFLFFTCKFAYQMLTLMNKEIKTIKQRLCNVKITPISIPLREDQPKVEGYGDSLNYNLKDILVDQFTNKDVQTLSKCCYQIVEIMGQGLRVIDSGPGLHLLSDSLEAFSLFINMQINQINDIKYIDDFKMKFKRFLTFIDKSVNDIIQSSDFRVFVDVINGEMKIFNSIKNSIPFYDKTANPYPLYEGVTINFVTAILTTMDDVCSANYTSIEAITEKMNTINDQKYTDDNLDVLLQTINDFNSAIIPFIDEYVDDSGRVLNDLQVIDFRRNYNLKTTGKNMDRMFEKLNYCIRKFIDAREKEFENRIIERFTIYVELFISKFKSLRNLEKYMITK